MPFVLQGQEYQQTRAVFGPVSMVTFTQGTITAASSTPTAGGTLALPCNVKILAAAASMTAGTYAPVAFNVTSGGLAGAGVLGGGLVAITGPATANGTFTLVIAGPTPGTSQTINVPYTSGQTAGQIGTAVRTAINVIVGSSVMATDDAAGNVTLIQTTSQALLTQLGGPQLYSASATAGTGVAATPTVPTAFSAGTMTVASPDNFATSTPSSVFAKNGQVLFPSFQIVPNASQNAVAYPPLMSSAPNLPPSSVPTYDIIWPCTRTLALSFISPTFGTTVTFRVSLLVMPVIVDPNQPYPAAAMWTPNQTTIGAPSTA